MPEVVIPITMFLCGAIIAVAAIILRSKRNQLDHKERMLALEKGQDLPHKPIIPSKEKNPYFWGFVLTAIGLTLTFYFALEYEREWFWGPMFLLVGLAILSSNMLHQRDLKKQREADKEKVNGVVKLVDDNGSDGAAT